MTAMTIQFDTGNAAFGPDGDGCHEAATILRKIADKVSMGDDCGAIFDTNGNRIGRWDVDYPETDEDEDA